MVTHRLRRALFVVLGLSVTTVDVAFAQSLDTLRITDVIESVLVDNPRLQSARLRARAGAERAQIGRAHV